MNKKLISYGILGLFLLSCVSAMTINFFYSDSCPHCQKVKPLIIEMQNKYPEKTFRYFDVNQGSYNVGGVPYIEIDTCDGRTIVSYKKCQLLNV